MALFTFECTKNFSKDYVTWAVTTDQMQKMRLQRSSIKTDTEVI